MNGPLAEMVGEKFNCKYEMQTAKSQIRTFSVQRHQTN
jgi:hypothetical protein